MCVLPKAPKIPPQVERQAMQVPQEWAGSRAGGLNARRRRGLWASIMTSPKGIAGPPTVTGVSSGLMGG